MKALKRRKPLRVIREALPKEGRTCGDCTACCTTLSVPTISKQADVPCEHLCSAGCGIYAMRPKECRTFHCAWRYGLGGSNDRPDVIGLLVHSTPAPVPLLVVREVWDGAIIEQYDWLEARGREGHLLALMDGLHRRVIGPPEKLRAAQDAGLIQRSP